MADSHERCANCDRNGATEPSVSDQTAGDRREINQTGVKTEDRRGERLNVERMAINDFQEMSKRGETGNMFDVARMEKPIDHVEHEERLHPVVREAFPSFGERDVTEPARVADETAVFRIVHEAK